MHHTGINFEYRMCNESRARVVYLWLRGDLRASEEAHRRARADDVTAPEPRRSHYRARLARPRRPPSPHVPPPSRPRPRAPAPGGDPRRRHPHPRAAAPGRARLTRGAKHDDARYARYRLRRRPRRRRTRQAPVHGDGSRHRPRHRHVRQTPGDDHPGGGAEHASVGRGWAPRAPLAQRLHRHHPRRLRHRAPGHPRALPAGPDLQPSPRRPLAG